MNTIHEVEIVIHVDEALDEQERGRLVDMLQGYAGVGQAKFTSGRDHLMVVSYDSSRLHASDVLQYVRQEHVNAELIGI